ncbi:hypothetical protein CKAN_00869100 [Cinnamomum micranthum f. kanehirae]|uniref:Uncharacterized protein n=1 Tax=Cinnamomum micranthum f. kanehirae TaxID=337451 RepID=A0A443NNM8_9MAGN|nr:hypothetical protein CKAN_00869100 [Cinnamomum micranthum f. kanehirae]
METKKNPREHIEEIRRVKFSIGGKPNPVMEDLHQAVKNLSAELYAKDVHFLMELIQNAEDNEYPPDVKPSLEFIISSKDITATGATSTLLIFNNEKGFSNKNIDSICSVGRSTKKGNRQRGYIGEKGMPNSEDNEDPKLNTVNAISISSETEFRRKKNIDAESMFLHLYAEENKIDQESECSYRMWRQNFLFALESRVLKEEWMLRNGYTLASTWTTLEQREDLARHLCVLPHGMVTNFPFHNSGGFCPSVFKGKQYCWTTSGIWEFYGNKISDYKEELKTGREQNNISLVNFAIACLRRNGCGPVPLGYRCPKESILFNAEVGSYSPNCIPPIHDDVDGYYGNRIYESETS